jgi:hypothetical protein
MDMEGNPDFVGLLRRLAEAKIKMVVIDGATMTLRADNYTTLDLDICFERSPENTSGCVERLRRIALRF